MTPRTLAAGAATVALTGAMTFGVTGVASADGTVGCQTGQQGQYPPGKGGADCQDQFGGNSNFQRSTNLPRTGTSDLIPLALAGAGLVGVGGAVVVAARRRREDSPGAAA